MAVACVASLIAWKLFLQSEQVVISGIKIESKTNFVSTSAIPMRLAVTVPVENNTKFPHGDEWGGAECFVDSGGYQS
jgi:hypothetical protein